MVTRILSKIHPVLIMVIILNYIPLFTIQGQETIQKTNGPEGIWTRSLAIHPSGDVFISAQNGSYYQSSDQGDSWELKSTRNTFSEAMVVTGWGEIFIGESRVFKSNDMAVTWEESNNGIPSTTILSMLFNKFNGDIIVGTYNDGIYVSSDSGATWVAKNGGLTDYASMRITGLYQHTDGVLYATGTNYSNGYIYRSTNHGEAWQVISDNIVDDKTFTDITVTSDDRVYVTTWYGSVFRSDPGGENFELATSGMRPDSYRTITRLPNDVLLVGATFEGVYRSDTYGDIWTSLSGSGLYGQDCWNIIYDELRDASYISMRNAGMFKSSGIGDIWEAKNNGLYHTNVEDIVITEDNTLFAGVFMAGVYRSYDGGNKWEWVSGQLSYASVNSLAYKPGYLFAGVSGSGIYISTNDGENWVESGLAVDVGWVMAMAIGPSGEIYAGLTTGEIHRSTDDGASWSLVYDAGDEIMDMVFNPHTNTMFAAVDDNTTGGVHRSFDGVNWSRQISGLGSNRVLSLAVSPVENLIYASTADNGIFISDDNGTSWYKPISSGLPNWISAVGVNSKGEIIAGGNKIYSSRDGGENYNVISDEPSSSNNAAFAFDASEVLYIGTNDGSVWRSVEPTTARRVHFAVTMQNEDGFVSSTQNVAVAGDFNEWATNDLILTVQDNEELLYTGMLTITDVSAVIQEGNFRYKYVIPPDKWELFDYNRTAEWDGNDDLRLDTVWFSNQKEFTKMATSAISADGTDSRGIAWADYDNDGFEDVIIVESGSTSRNDLFHNNGDGSFTQITTGPIGTDTGDSRSACWGDYDNDGFVDLYITNFGGENNFLYKNNRDGSFTSITGSETVINGGNSVSAVWADFDNDGFLDLFVANSGSEPNSLYMNNQDGTFMTVSGESVVTDVSDSRGCAAADYDNDGDVDIFVANAGEGENNFLYENDQFGNFSKRTADVVVNDGAISLGGSWGDYNNDGWLDLYVTNVNGTPNLLYKNDQSGSFSVVGPAEIPKDSTDSRGSAWVDFDNDGLLDLFVANAGDQKNILYKQRAGGIFFRVSTGPVVEDPNTNSIGAAWADFNDDGSTDLIVANQAGSNPLYQNNISVNHFLKVNLIGSRSNRSALGAVILAYFKNTEGTTVSQRRDILGQSGFLSQNSPTVTFGFGPVSTVDSLVVFWPGGMKESVSTISGIDQTLTITETIPSALPPAPILNSPSYAETGISVNPTLSWNQAGDADQYHLLLSPDSLFKSVTAEDTMIDPTSYTLSGLQYESKYFWKVRAKNDAGWGPWSQLWHFYTEEFTGTATPPVLISPTDGHADSPIPAPLTWTSDVTGTYAVEVSTDNMFSSVVFNQGGIVNRYIFVSDLQFNTTYYWRVNVTVGSITSTWSDTSSFTTFKNMVDVSTQIPFATHDRRDEFASTDYLMIGMPGNSNSNFNDVLGDGAGEIWMAYLDNGSTGSPTDYFVPYDGSNLFRFTTGHAFWIISNGPINIAQNFPVAQLNGLAQAEVSIHSGWNMITCPFGHSISWNFIKQVNSINASLPLYGYNRSAKSFTERTDLMPVEGFYFYNNPAAGRTSLLIPYYDPLGKPLAKSALAWEARIELSSGETKSASVRIGTGNSAEIGLDDADHRKPRALAKLADIYFLRPEWDEKNVRFGSDVRPPINEFEIWDFQVYTPQKGTAVLSFPEINNIPENFDIFLVDKTHRTYQNLRDDENYDFISSPEISNFEIIIGETQAVEEQLESILPMEYTLGQNYPNPFNPTTTIPLTLPEQSDVTLKVFNILGQEVLTLFNGKLNAGKHYFTWEGTNLTGIPMPTGIYIYRMTTNTGIHFTGKMVMIK